MTEDKTKYQELENEILKLKLELKIQGEIINKIPIPFFVKDKDFKYLNCNDAFVNYLGLPKPKLINSTNYDVLSKELADKYYIADCKLRDGLENQIYESKVVYSDGTLHDIIFHKARLINEKNEFYGIIGFMLDITANK
jgi:PAS domain S-box-containing protein